jgi:Ser/Thr protein kinase RdoA (MazF antagonist)
MKSEAPTLDKRLLIQMLREEFGLDVAGLTFIPFGEESYSYRADTFTCERYFVKLHTELRPAKLEETYQAVAWLRSEGGLALVVSPIATRQGKLLCELGPYAIAVFPFVDGAARPLEDYSEQGWRQLAQQVAAIHDSAGTLCIPEFPRETFALSFRSWLLEVLEASGQIPATGAQYARQAQALLAQERNNILETLSKLEELAAQAQALASHQLLTHGDLGSGNILEDADGQIHVIDWGKICLAPAERDLLTFIGPRFDSFLRSYVNARQTPPILHGEVFAYYIYWGILAAIADYGSWLILEDASPEDAAHAWRQLAAVLPIRHEEVQGQLEKIQRLLAEFDNDNRKG